MKKTELMMKYLSNKDFYTEIDESTGNKVKLILASGIRKIINKEKIQYSLYMISCQPMTVKGKDGFHVVVKCQASDDKGNKSESYGSCSPLTSDSNYTIEMAEKRSISRAILMLKNVYGEYMGADEFAIQSSLKLPKL